MTAAPPTQPALCEEDTYPPVHAAKPTGAALPAADPSALLRFQRLVLIAGARLGLRAPHTRTSMPSNTVGLCLCNINVLACLHRLTLQDLTGLL